VLDSLFFYLEAVCLGHPKPAFLAQRFDDEEEI